LVDARTGENLFTNTVAGRLSKEDKYQDAVPLAGINGDQLELPTETDVLDELTNAKVSEIGRSVLRHFSSLEVEYNNQALPADQEKEPGRSRRAFHGRDFRREHEGNIDAGSRGMQER